MSIKEDSDSSDDLIEESITLMFSPDSVSPDSLQIRKLSAP